jgi:hypothetical protein
MRDKLFRNNRWVGVLGMDCAKHAQINARAEMLTLPAQNNHAYLGRRVSPLKGLLQLNPHLCA